MSNNRYAVITENPLNIGLGNFDVGVKIEIVGETKCYYRLFGGWSINKKHMAIAGTADHSHSVKVKVIK